jgi:hypothetical protein
MRCPCYLYVRTFKSKQNMRNIIVIISHIFTSQPTTHYTIIYEVNYGAKFDTYVLSFTKT